MQREQKLQRAVNALTKYFGLYNATSLAAAIANEQLSGPGASPSTSQQSQLQAASGPPEGPAASEDSQAIAVAPDAILASVIALFIDSSEGGYTAMTLANRVAQQLEDADEDTKARVRSLIKMYGTSAPSFREIQNPAADAPTITVNSLLAQPVGQGSVINGNDTSEPTKAKPGLSIIFSNSKRVSQASRHANAVTIFMNGTPSVEIARAVPYLNVDFLFARPPVSDLTNQLQTPSLLKFLYGAEVIPGSDTPGTVKPYRSLALGNQITVEGSTGRDPTDNTYTTAGMEMFTSPQTLVNADEIDKEQNRSNPVLDRFRPFMTLKDFEVTVVGTTGLANYKTAKLTIILHDRSRLADVADFVRPDLYGQTELLIEYGWSHPDGEQDSVQNPYGDLINGMRCREKFGVINSSYTFDEAGQVVITLSLSMRGGVDTTTEVISSDQEGLGNALRAVTDLQETISRIRQRSFQQGTRTREIRGIQILDAAQDAMSHSILSSDLRTELRNFRRTLDTSGTSPDVTRLREALEELFGTDSELGTARRGAGVNAQGAVGAVRAAVLASITQKIARFATTEDPFIRELPPSATGTGFRAGASRQAADAVRADGSQAGGRIYQASFGGGAPGPGQRVSLASLFLHFVGEPLAMTHKFDDVQLVFYPFNTRAGYASLLNVGNFEVDLAFFTQEFSRIRLANVSRSANMNLREFMNFIGQVIVDDPAAKSYGLWDEEGAFYREVYNSEGTTRSTESVSEVPQLQQRIENRLRGVTPDGTFDMPQIEFYMECLPERESAEDGAQSGASINKSILRLHIYDRKASSYESLGSLLASSRDGEMSAVGRIPGGLETSGNPDVVRNTAQDQTAFISSAERYNLIQAIENTDPVMYRISGGPRKLKEFLYRTMPYMIYGAQGTLIKAANVSSMQNPELATVNMLRSFRSSELQPNGELPGGLPMRIIPSECTMQTLGCPLFVYTQQFFVDFQTGTSADNIYGVVGLIHKITEGEFTTDVRFAPFDAYGRYDSFMNRVFNARQILVAAEREAEGETETPQTQPSTITRAGTG